VGGEQGHDQCAAGTWGGSSPRGRGTAAGVGNESFTLRFIPAWAGNSTATPLALASTAVHPRVGGEQGGGDLVYGINYGSSPRGRGTGESGHRLTATPRFIPAWAGNSHRALFDPVTQAVHPRVGGEQLLGRHPIRLHSGSSPRGRGTDCQGAAVGG